MSRFRDCFPRPQTGGTALLAVAAMIMGSVGCTSGPGNPTRSVSVSVAPGHAETLRLAGGLRIDVPAHAVTGNGTLSATVRRAPAAAPRGMKLTGQVYDLHLAGTGLAAPVTLTVPVPHPSGQGATAGPDTALLAYYNQASGQWQPVSATYRPAVGTLTAAVGHLSIWSVLQLAGQQALDYARRALASFLGAVTVTSPSCPNAGQLASAGVTVTADSGDLVKWCADYSNGATVLRVVGNRGYAIEASYPAGWSVTRPGTLDPVTQAILRGVPALSLKAGGPNVRTVIIPGGQEVDITPQAGASGIVLAAPSAEGIIIDALSYAASTLAMTYSNIPGARPTPDSTAKTIATAFSDASCVAKMDAVAHNPDVSTAQATGALFRGLTDIAAGCLAEHWSGAYGLTGPAAAFATGTLLWLADGLNSVISDSQAAVDSVLYWNGYHITVRASGGGGSMGSPAPGTYQINRQIYNDGSLQVTLDRAQVAASRHVTFQITYHNLGSTDIALTCTGDTDPTTTTLTLADGTTRQAVATYCSDHPDQANLSILPGQSFGSYAVFASASGLAQPFTFNWQGSANPSGTVTEIRLG